MAWLIYMLMPEDPAVLAAVGKIALRHGQLDHVLRMTIKSLTGVSMNEALDATARQSGYANWHDVGSARVLHLSNWKQSLRDVGGRRRSATSYCTVYGGINLTASP